MRSNSLVVVAELSGQVVGYPEGDVVATPLDHPGGVQNPPLVNPDDLLSILLIRIEDKQTILVNNKSVGIIIHGCHGSEANSGR